ncbi:hypothetical protein XVE_3357, partial [Xanthomonas vesicatoria ATCC 35937]
QRGSDGITRVVAVTSSEDIWQALSEERDHRQESATVARVSEATGDGDTSTSESSNPQQVLDIQARMQASVAAQARQEREQQDRVAHEQHVAQVREHLQQAQPEHEDRSQSEQAVQAQAVLEGQRQAAQQREQKEREQQERQSQASQQRELQEREERDVEQRQAQERQADNQQREQQDRQAQEARQVEVQESQARQAQQHASQQADPQPHAPNAALAQQTTRPQLQQEDARQQPEVQNQQTGEQLAHNPPDPPKQTPGPDDAQLRQAQEAERAFEPQSLQSRDTARIQVPPSEDRESGNPPLQSAQADAVTPALYRQVQTQQAEMEQTPIRHQDAAREQETEPVRVMAPTTPATADPWMAPQARALSTPEQETKAEQPRPSDTLIAAHGAPLLPPQHLAQAHEQSPEASAVSRSFVVTADAENQRTQSTPAQDSSGADPGGALFLEETMRSLRQLQQEIERADREDERFHQEWKAYRDRGEPYPFAQKRALD